MLGKIPTKPDCSTSSRGVITQQLSQNSMMIRIQIKGTGTLKGILHGGLYRCKTCGFKGKNISYTAIIITYYLTEFSTTQYKSGNNGAARLTTAAKESMKHISTYLVVGVTLSDPLDLILFIDQLKSLNLPLKISVNCVFLPSHLRIKLSM